MKDLRNFQEIDDLLLSFKGVCPGCALAIMHKGKSVYTSILGYADLEKKIIVTSCTNFRLASISKQFIAVAILFLVERGFFSLENNLSNFFPYFPKYGQSITIYHLLTHSSGIKDYELQIPKYQKHQMHDEDIFEFLKMQNCTYFPSGTKYLYSNSGYCLLRLIVERVSGQDIHDFLTKNIFLPLGMRNTLVNREAKTIIPHRAYGYSEKGGLWLKTDQDFTSATIGDGGIYSSIEDLLKWNEAFYTNKVLSSKIKNIIFERHILTDEGEGVFYGLGFFIKKHKGNKIIYHGGSSIGFRTCFYMIPDKELSIIFLSNRNSGSGSLICDKINDIVLNQILGKNKVSIERKGEIKLQIL